MKRKAPPGGDLNAGVMTTRIDRAVFPGSFDPLTNGHTDIIARSLRVFDRLLIAVLQNPGKQTLFSAAERAALIREDCAEFGDRVEVHEFSGLLVEFARRAGTPVIIRGLRAVSDFEYEVQMALANRSLCAEMETCFLVTREQNSFVSSSLVKQIATLGGDVSNLVPPAVNAALLRRFART